MKKFLIWILVTALFAVALLWMPRVATVIGGVMTVIFLIFLFIFAGGQAEDEELYPEQNLRGIKQYGPLIFLATFTSIGVVRWYTM